MKEAIIILNEQHKLLPEQEAILTQRFGKFETLSVPANGWTKVEQEQAIMHITCQIVVFVSPIPYMIKKLSMDAAGFNARNDDHGGLLPCPMNTAVKLVFVMANDTREKKELPGGKVISVTAKTGWYLA
jgi:hypothetical protein